MSRLRGLERVRWLVGSLAGGMLLLMVALPASAQEQVTVTMAAGRDQPAQTGTATLTARGNQTEVVLSLTSGGAGVSQPAHIHEGRCPNVGGVRHPLTNVVDGRSTTTVNVALRDLQTGNLAINVHKSTQEAAVYTSCGNIPAAAPAALPRAGDPLSDNALWLAAAAAAILIAGGLYLRRRRTA